MVYVLMGVSGSGKTSVGKYLSSYANLPFYDADEFHPINNIEKMSAKIPLNDEDREPWLDLLSHKIREWNTLGDSYLACSCLKNKYREKLSLNNTNNLKFIYLETTLSTIKDRIKNRENHFFPIQLVESQFHILEVTKDLIRVNANQPIKQIVDEILEVIK